MLIEAAGFYSRKYGKYMQKSDLETLRSRLEGSLRQNYYFQFAKVKFPNTRLPAGLPLGTTLVHHPTFFLFRFAPLKLNLTIILALTLTLLNPSIWAPSIAACLAFQAIMP